MANTVSSIKRVRQTKRRTLVNRARKSRLRHQLRKLQRLLEAKEAEAAKAAVPQTFSIIDRATRWGIIKKNTAARYKSRLHVRLKALAGA
jgi:small subunit ribosomal protein S20